MTITSMIDAPGNVTDVCSTYMCCLPYITCPDPGISARLMHVECMSHMHLTTVHGMHAQPLAVVGFGYMMSVTDTNW